jgi:ABC-type uncharacterized transport system permease subunit
MLQSILGVTSVFLYVAGFFYLLAKLLKQPFAGTLVLQTITGAAIMLHASVAVQLLISPQGLDLSLFNIFVLIAFIINLIVFIRGQRKHLYSMCLVLFPLSALSLVAAMTIPGTKPVALISANIQIHVLSSILAYSLLAIAALHALLTGYQNWHLKHKRQNWLMRTFPPMQTMETFLFELIWAGEILLTLSLVSGFLFYENMFDQKLIHKATLSVVAWIVYAMLLWGRHYRGWRGVKAISWCWVGFIAILMGYVGSKVVLEFILA